MKKGTSVLIFMAFCILIEYHSASAKNVCRPLRTYRIDVIADILDDSLKWQKDLAKHQLNDPLSPSFIEKIFSVKPSEEIILSFKKNEFRKGFYPDSSKIIYITYENNRFLIKRKENSKYRKISSKFIEKYHSFSIAFIPQNQSGMVIVYKKDKAKASSFSMDFYLLSARYAFLCKPNIEHPLSLTLLHSPDSYPRQVYIMGNFVFTFDNQYYKLYFFKENSDTKGKLFTYYYEPGSKIPKYVEIIKKRNNFYILDFNRAVYHYCLANNNLQCPENMNANSIELPMLSGQKDAHSR